MPSASSPGFAKFQIFVGLRRGSRLKPCSTPGSACMTKHLHVYRTIPADVYRLVAGEFLLHLVNSAFLLIFNIYLAKLGYGDPYIGDVTAMRYLGVLVAAIPIGLYIRGR